MRLQQRGLKTVYLKTATKNTDAEGSSHYTYASEGKAIKASIQPASSNGATAKMYGEKAANMLTMRYEGTEAIKENDGICVFVASSATPDYKVKAKQPWDIPVYDLEAI